MAKLRLWARLNGKVLGGCWALLAEADHPDELHEARVAFVGPLSEWQDHPADGELYARDIRVSVEQFGR